MDTKTVRWVGIVFILIGVILNAYYLLQTTKEPDKCHKHFYGAVAAFLGMGIVLVVLSFTGVNLRQTVGNFVQTASVLSSGLQQPGFQQPGFQQAPAGFQQAPAGFQQAPAAFQQGFQPIGPVSGGAAE